MILMDLWMPVLDGYSASEQILAMQAEDQDGDGDAPPTRPYVTFIAMTADVADLAFRRVSKARISEILTNPYALLNLEKKIVEFHSSGGQLGFKKYLLFRNSAYLRGQDTP